MTTVLAANARPSPWVETCPDRAGEGGHAGVELGVADERGDDDEEQQRAQPRVAQQREVGDRLGRRSSAGRSTRRGHVRSGPRRIDQRRQVAERRRAGRS